MEERGVGGAGSMPADNVVAAVAGDGRAFGRRGPAEVAEHLGGDAARSGQFFHRARHPSVGVGEVGAGRRPAVSPPGSGAEKPGAVRPAKFLRDGPTSRGASRQILRSGATSRGASRQTHRTELRPRGTSRQILRTERRPALRRAKFPGRSYVPRWSRQILRTEKRRAVRPAKFSGRSYIPRGIAPNSLDGATSGGASRQILRTELRPAVCPAKFPGRRNRGRCVPPSSRDGATSRGASRQILWTELRPAVRPSKFPGRSYVPR